jgi:hypothetical protein
MERFVHEENLRYLRRLLALTTDDAKRQRILRLLTEEEAKDRSSPQEGSA